MNNRTAKACKISSVIIGILGFIECGKLSYSAATENINLYSVSESECHIDLNVFIRWFLSTFAGVFFICLLLYAVGEIIVLLEGIKENGSKNMSVNMVPSEGKEPKSNVELPHKETSVLHMKTELTEDGTWTCPNCKYKNPGSTQYCIGCGEHR